MSTNRFSYTLGQGIWVRLFGLAMLCCGSVAYGSTPLEGAHTIAREAFQERVELEGVFESRTMREIKVEPEVFSVLEIQSVVAHGEQVNEGDVLVKLDLSKLREQIEEMEFDGQSSGLALAAAEDELRNLEQSTALRLDAARRAMSRANDDYTYFQETDRTEKLSAAEFNLKSAEQRLEGVREELDQLEQMYAADDLTEETEEIVIKRQRYAVESAEFFLARTKLGNARLVGTTIPREEETLKAAKLEQDLAYGLAETSLPRALEQKRVAVAKMKREGAKNEEKLADLRRDLRRLNVRAPMDGLVYYGNCQDGKWVSGAAMAKKLVPGGKLTAGEIFMTVVSADDLMVRVIVAENKLGQLREGQEGEATPVVYSDQKLKAWLETLGFVPLPGASGFEGIVAVEPAKGSRLMPGMNCKLTFLGKETSKALSAPRAAVFDETDEKYVYVVREEGEPERKKVKTGRAEGDRVEILDGLSEGDRILLEKP